MYQLIEHGVELHDGQLMDGIWDGIIMTTFIFSLVKYHIVKSTIEHFPQQKSSKTTTQQRVGSDYNTIYSDTYIYT